MRSRCTALIVLMYLFPAQSQSTWRICPILARIQSSIDMWIYIWFPQSQLFRTTFFNSTIWDVPWRDCVQVNMLFKCNKSAAANCAVIAIWSLSARDHWLLFVPRVFGTSAASFILTDLFFCFYNCRISLPWDADSSLLVKKSPYFPRTWCSLPYSQEPATALFCSRYLMYSHVLSSFVLWSGT
jgi:hypothetical protein